MASDTFSFMSPKLEAGKTASKGGMGVFARRSVAKGEVLAVWGGKVVPLSSFANLPDTTRRHAVQIEEDLYLVAGSRPEPADYINHCCDPNAGMLGQVVVVAMRDIAPGEEVCIDYAMCDGTPYDEFECDCGAAGCRKRVSGDDWASTELQTRYEGYFSPYLARRIARGSDRV